MTPRANSYIGVVSVLALAAASAAFVVRPPGAVEVETLSILVALTIGVVVAAALPMDLPTGHHKVTMEEAVLVAMLVAAPLGVVPALVMLGTLLHGLHRRTPTVKAAFNTAIAGLGAAGAVLVVIGLESLVDDQVVARIAVAVFGSAVASTIQLVLLALLFALLGEARFRDGLSLRGFVDVSLGLNLTIGALLAAAVVADPWLAWLDVLAIAVLGLLLRGLGRPVG